jgi:pyrroloquinoline quinone biosynthesis protein D
MAGVVTTQAIPALRRGIRRQYDVTREQNVLLCPERVILLDEIGDAIIELCDGQRTIATISLTLAKRYAEDLAQVEVDVTSFVQELTDKGVVTV